MASERDRLAGELESLREQVRKGEGRQKVGEMDSKSKVRKYKRLARELKSELKTLRR